VATSGKATIGKYQNGVGQVNVSDGKWTIGDLLVVGDQGEGRLTISDGGVVTGNTLSSNGTVGLGNGSQGQVRVDGDGSQWSLSRLAVGYAGNGTVTVTNGGVLDIRGRILCSPGKVGSRVCFALAVAIAQAMLPRVAKFRSVLAVGGTLSAI